MHRQTSLSVASAVILLAFVAHAAEARTIQIEITKLAFAPATATAEAGDTIEWTNNDTFVHTATADDKSWEVMLPVGGNGRYIVERAGTIAYFCRFHPNMRGLLEVTDP